ncbi:hypothetical protein [Frankia sp. AgKG'84/4]|uniref:hypothetical protein n=1 Tax=Frankia sp. AgKG'84/4 TaxID=573490 RepID=UPI002029B55C|nr:hypothetical protein [Frankia sp. AgKG'84/4]MCL9794959.1 hypothetical protein [Frankia sp. AgKG'84/4]
MDLESPRDPPAPDAGPGEPTAAERKARLLDQAHLTRAAPERLADTEPGASGRPTGDSPQDGGEPPRTNDRRPPEHPGAADRLAGPADRRSATGDEPTLSPLERKLALLDRAHEQATDSPAERTGQPVGDSDIARGRDGSDRLGWRLSRVWKDSQPTVDGRAFYEKSDEEMWQAAATAEPAPGKYTADLHGSPDAVHVGRRDLDARQLAALIRRDDNWQGRPIRLMSCETGQGDNPIAQDLADELGVTVTAPTELAFSDEDTGKVWTTSMHENEYGRLVQTVPHDGHWIDFHPTAEGKRNA